MKKIFITTLSLTILFILNTIVCASEPTLSDQMYKTPSRPAFRKPQSSEYLKKCAQRCPMDIPLTFISSDNTTSSEGEEDNGESSNGDVDGLEGELNFRALLERL